MFVFTTIMTIDSTYHPEWQNNRIKYIKKLYGDSYFNGKTLLELGSHNGYIGNAFVELGADVTIVEGRQENIDNILDKYPHFNDKIILSNLDREDWPYGVFDIIVNFGVLYHLEHYHGQHLRNCIRNSKDIRMLLESVIFDSKISTLHTRDEEGSDQSLSNIGKTPSARYVEDIFAEEIGSIEKLTLHTSSQLNGSAMQYDWPYKHSDGYNSYKRRFWSIDHRKT
jgi:2-polyprenyl-3-methyl-5-hydroxy-6-metoxy-1,4-benzoquinol methylase